MAITTDAAVSGAVRRAAHPLDERAPDYEPLFRLIRDARFVRLGEASHGTHEFYPFAVEGRSGSRRFGATWV